MLSITFFYNFRSLLGSTFISASVSRKCQFSTDKGFLKWNMFNYLFNVINIVVILFL